MDYIGAKVQLISKSQIRYEGILIGVDFRENTVSFSKVRSFGTEGRPAAKPVEARDQIYQYIIFRCSDILDIWTVEPALNDPGVISAQLDRPKGSPFMADAPSVDPVGSSSKAEMNETVARMFSNVRNEPNGQLSGLAGQAGAGSFSNASPESIVVRKSPVSDAGAQVPLVESKDDKLDKPLNSQDHSGHSGRHDGGHDRGDRQRRDNRNFNQYRDHQRNRSGSRRTQNYQRRDDGYSYNRRQNPPDWHVHGERRQPQHMWGSIPPPLKYGAPPYRSNNMNGAGRYHGPRQPMNRSHNNQSQPVSERPGTDFDFEKSNQEFKELTNKLSATKIDDTEVKESTEEVVTNDEKKDDPFYDKNKSFFDTISCEGIERTKGNVNKVDWKHERKVNAETFGISVNYRRVGIRGRYRSAGGYNGRQNYNNRNHQPRWSGPNNNSNNNRRDNNRKRESSTTA